jgi:hypothetical protein
MRKINKHCHRQTKIGARTFRTSSAAIRFLLARSKYPQAEIARRCKVTPACVSQLATSR